MYKNVINKNIINNEDKNENNMIFIYYNIKKIIFLTGIFFSPLFSF